MDHKREHRTPHRLARVMGVGRQQVSLPGFGIGMINEDFHVAGIRQAVTGRLKRAVMH